MTDWSSLKIDANELQRHIDELGAIGTHPDGGLYRGLYTPAWQEAMDLVGRWMGDAGLAVRRDAVGNLFGRVSGTDDRGTVMTGSHIDTVKQGGKYDGALGIHAALAATAALVRAFGPPRCSIDVLAICEEEGSRFHSNFWGARAICGWIAPDEPDTLRDPAGTTIGEAMRERGFDPGAIPQARREDVDAFVELHIEQGRILETESQPIGVVQTITGQRQLRVQVAGRQDHAGTTPMDLRRDAMAGAAEMIVGVTNAAARMGRPAVATVGTMQVAPGAVNIVPGTVTFTIDTRHSEPEPRAALLEAINEVLQDVAQRCGLELAVQTLIEHDPVPLDPRMRATIARAAQEEGLSYLEMPSGAGHDSQIFAQKVPTGMVFVPSREGRSHTPAEYTPIEQVIPGVRVLARTLYALAYEPS